MNELSTTNSNKSLLRNDEHNYISAATTPNTRKAYQSDIRHFIKCGGLLPTTPSLVIQYLENNARVLNPRTLIRRLTAIKQWHVYQNYSDPTSHSSVRKTLKGIQNTHGLPKEKARIITLDELVQMVGHLNQSNRLIDFRDKAILLIGFFGAFRRSELVAIHKGHIRELPEGVEILIPRSKTDSKGEGQICSIPYGTELLCPVKALLNWCKIAKIEEGPIFKRISKIDRVLDLPIAPNHINIILKKIAKEIQLSEFDKISSHSLRRSFATLASQKGATFSAIMRQGRWRHERTVLGYIEAGKAFEDNAANVILQADSKAFTVD